MSVSASIDVMLSKNLQRSATGIIQVLVNSGWTLTHDGYIGFLPLGDKDDFDWKAEKIDIETLNSIIKEKECANELVGVTMTWKDTDFGGAFLFWHLGGFSWTISKREDSTKRSKVGSCFSS